MNLSKLFARATLLISIFTFPSTAFAGKYLLMPNQDVDADVVMMPHPLYGEAPDVQKDAYYSVIEIFKIIVTILLVMLSNNVAAMSSQEERDEVRSCVKNTKTLEAMAECERKASEAGNSEASYGLAYSYETGTAYGGVGKNDAEAERLKLLAYKQGNLGAKLWYMAHYIPPKPYKWQVGMSKNQVINSVDGEPEKKIKRSTENGVTEVWVYTGAYLFFGSIKENYGCLKEIQEIQ